MAIYRDYNGSHPIYIFFSGNMGQENPRLLQSGPSTSCKWGYKLYKYWDVHGT